VRGCTPERLSCGRIGEIAFCGRSLLTAHIPSITHDHSDPSAWGLRENSTFRSFISKTWLRVVWRNGSGAVEWARESWVATLLGTDVAGWRGRFVRGVGAGTKMADQAGSAGVVVGFQARQVMARWSSNEARAFLVVPRSLPQIP
jgi:hypothetical protein